MNTFSIKTVLTFGWETFKKEPWKLIAAFVVAMIISIISSTVFEPKNAGMLTPLFFVINAVIQMVVSLGMISFVLKAHDYIHNLSLMDAWRPERLLNYIITTVLVSLVTLVGFILLIVPGIIAAITLMFTPYLVVDKGMKPIDAMKESYRLSKGHWLDLFLLMIVLIVLNVIGALLLGVGLLVSIPVTMLTIAHTYRTLSGATALVPQAA